MSTSKRILVVIPVLALGLGLVVAVREAAALPERAAAPSLDAASSFAQNLAAQKGKTVTLHLASGESISGKVEAVGSDSVHLSGLTGKELYDGLVRLDGIVALEARGARE